MAAASALLACILVACSSPPDGTWQRLQETRTLRVGMDASFPPFESIATDGSLVGFDVDLARELSRRLDLEPQFVANLPYDGLYDALTAERVDIVISALVVDPSRTADYAYSRSYFDAGQVLVSREGEKNLDSMKDLGGHSVAVVLGTAGDREARDWARRLVDLAVLHYATPQEVLTAMETGDVDLALVDHVSALKAVGAEKDVTIVGEPVVKVPYACAMRDDSRQLADAVNQALRAMQEDGTMERLIVRWLR